MFAVLFYAWHWRHRLRSLPSMMCCCRFRERTRYISLVLTTQTGKRSLTCSNIKTEFSLSVEVGDDVWRDIIWLSGEAWSLWDFDILSFLDKVSTKPLYFAFKRSGGRVGGFFAFSGDSQNTSCYRMYLCHLITEGNASG